MYVQYVQYMLNTKYLFTQATHYRDVWDTVKGETFYIRIKIQTNKVADKWNFLAY